MYYVLTENVLLHSVCMYIYIYIHKREREMCVYIYTYTCIQSSAPAGIEGTLKKTKGHED